MRHPPGVLLGHLPDEPCPLSDEGWLGLPPLPHTGDLGDFGGGLGESLDALWTLPACGQCDLCGLPPWLEERGYPCGPGEGGVLHRAGHRCA